MVSHCRQLQKQEGFSQSALELEKAIREVDCQSEAEEHILKVAGCFPHVLMFVVLLIRPHTVSIDYFMFSLNQY